nr:hypothetical protein [Tanacetum cinerariifolium]
NTVNINLNVKSWSAQVDNGCLAPIFTEGSSRVGISVSNPRKRMQRNVASEEFPSRRVQQSTTTVRNACLILASCEDGERVRSRRSTVVAREDGEGCSSHQTTGTSSAYTDLGYCDQEWHHCGIAFWFEERLKGHSNYRRLEYHLCCEGGKVYIEPNPDPPETEMIAAKPSSSKIQLMSSSQIKPTPPPPLTTLMTSPPPDSAPLLTLGVSMVWFDAVLD